nr:ribonuclease H-like domain-containing protein [Tanacetum cinerariifolium]
MEAIEKRFRGNKESKKVHKILLKQQYENFNGTSSEGLDHIYDRLQNLISQLKIHRETISQEDLNLKLLRSLQSEWKTHTLILRNKPDLETLSMDDLYNNLKIYEAEVIGSSSTTLKHTNVAFMSSNNTNSTNKAVNTAHGVSAANSKTNASNLLNVDSLRDGLKVADGNVDYETQKIPTEKKKESSQGVDIQVLENQVNDKNNTGEGYHAVPPTYIGNFMPPKPDLVFAEEHVVSETITSLPDIAKSKVKTSKTKLKNVSAPIIKDWVSDSDDENKIKTESNQIKPSFDKVKFVKPTEHVKSLRKSIKKEDNNRQTKYPWKNSQSPRGKATTVGKKAVVSVVHGNRENVVKSSAFGGSPNRGKIYRKGKIRTRKLDFEDVYFVKELKFNLFTVSQMCDKKNSVLFTKTECLVLSPDFKLLDGNQVLLKVPRQNNIYSFDLKKVAPFGERKAAQSLMYDQAYELYQPAFTNVAHGFVWSNICKDSKYKDVLPCYH